MNQLIMKVFVEQPQLHRVCSLLNCKEDIAVNTYDICFMYCLVPWHKCNSKVTEVANLLKLLQPILQTQSQKTAGKLGRNC